MSSADGVLYIGTKAMALLSRHMSKQFCSPADAMVEAWQAKGLHQDTLFVQHIWYWH